MTKLCIIAGNYKEAKTWADGQNLSDKDWFYPHSERDLIFRSNFITLVVGTAGENIPSALFEKIYALALKRGGFGR